MEGPQGQKQIDKHHTGPTPINASDLIRAGQQRGVRGQAGQQPAGHNVQLLRRDRLASRPPREIL
ncbi:hypothetical protein ACFYXF_27360 [Streptomyces sp. NPDC002680]|uniref:hypothetical protein n=1 Tax=Streptomyces sp. NPDC002680 TaxID=3364659 RepID=UPI00369CFFDB